MNNMQPLLAFTLRDLTLHYIKKYFVPGLKRAVPARHYNCHKAIYVDFQSNCQLPFVQVIELLLTEFIWYKSSLKGVVWNIRGLIIINIIIIRINYFKSYDSSDTIT